MVYAYKKPKNGRTPTPYRRAEPDSDATAVTPRAREQREQLSGQPAPTAQPQSDDQWNHAAAEKLRAQPGWHADRANRTVWRDIPGINSATVLDALYPLPSIYPVEAVSLAGELPRTRITIQAATFDSGSVYVINRTNARLDEELEIKTPSASPRTVSRLFTELMNCLRRKL